MLKIHIFYNLKQGPYGGGNQFLAFLKNGLLAHGAYEEDWQKADIYLFNSVDQLPRFIDLKRHTSGKIFIFRLDNIMAHYRGKKWGAYDKLLVRLANELADGIIFQSAWSREQFIKLGVSETKTYTVIHNNVDRDIFNKAGRKNFDSKHINLIATSWSDNWLKGFEFLNYLDQHLDQERYAFKFIGRSPIKFGNTKMLPPLSSPELAKELKQSDIYISGVTKDACSNAIIEALACGLPVIAYNGCSNPELIKNAGELFKDGRELNEKIEKVAQNYSQYQNSIALDEPATTIDQYLQFMTICKPSQPINWIKTMSLKAELAKAFAITKLIII